MIEGTAWIDDPEEFSHWTAGCVGTTEFLERLVAHDEHTRRSQCHNAAFSAALRRGRYLLNLSHGDDPYDPIASLPAPITEFPISQAQEEAWFGAGIPPDVKNIGRRPNELSLQYLPGAATRRRGTAA
jgi:hypothetical protein